MSARRYTLACLSGNGVGPELMAEASRALAAAARPHGLTVDEVHAPFGSEAFMRMGHPLPLSTRRAYREADAVLVAGADPALAGVEADLDLRVSLARVLVPGRVDLCVVGPFGESADEWAVDKAFELACARRGRVAAVGTDAGRRNLVARAVDACPGLHVEELTRPRALPLVAAEPEHFDVVLVGDESFAEALVTMAAIGVPGKVVAFGRLSAGGPGLFFPDHGVDEEEAGQGTADPGPVLLAAALALGEGLGERAAARTLEGALVAARLGVTAATTREQTDAVLAVLPSAVANGEFLSEVAA